jgi:hypothetical protein
MAKQKQIIRSRHPRVRITVTKANRSARTLIRLR